MVPSFDHTVELQDPGLEPWQLNADRGDTQRVQLGPPVFRIGNDYVLDTFASDRRDNLRIQLGAVERAIPCSDPRLAMGPKSPPRGGVAARSVSSTNVGRDVA